MSRPTLPPSSPDASLPVRLLAETICRREEAQGHPLDDAAADAAARAAGGDLLARIHARARHLPDAGPAVARLRRLLASARYAAMAVWGVSALAGAGAAALALGGDPLNLPLVLLMLVGVNLLMLILWLALLLLGGRPGQALATAWSGLAARTGWLPQVPDDPVRAAVPVLFAGRRATWLLGTVVHLAWLFYALAGFLVLALLMSLRAYELSWQTTLLDRDTLAALAGALSWWPGLLGLAPPETLMPGAPMDEATRQAWARWLLVAVLAYGVLPRALAAAACAALAGRQLRRIGTDLRRPGFARLRERLMPDHGGLLVVDPAPSPASVPVAATTPGGHAANELPPLTGVHALSLEWPAGEARLAGRGWHWHGALDEPAVQAAAVERFRHQPPAAVVVAARATATPDRGLERSLQCLIEGLPDAVPVWLLLGELDRLQARGPAACTQRLHDWQALAQRAGARDLLLWDGNGVRRAADVEAIA